MTGISEPDSRVLVVDGTNQFVTSSGTNFFAGWFCGIEQAVSLKGYVCEIPMVEAMPTVEFAIGGSMAEVAG